MRLLNLILFLLIVIFVGCSDGTDTPHSENQVNDSVVVITTNYGSIKIKLFKDTPKHKENFLKLTQSGFYTGTIFHRVVKDFVIQGGDPFSKIPDKKDSVGGGTPGYNVDAEILPQYFHKRGAVAAARTGDQINPLKKSSGSQFYIVQGRTYSNEDLDAVEADIYNRQFQSFAFKFRDLPENQWIQKIDIEKLQKINPDSLKRLNDKLTKLLYVNFEKEQKPFQFSKLQREIYQKLGGAPFLDAQYTVFGEVIEGLEVVDKIANLETNEAERPYKPCTMTVKMVE